MAFDSARFHEAFFEEAAEHLATVEATLLALESRDRDPELLHAIFRAEHSIKGASGTFGFSEEAILDEGTMWPMSWAVTELDAANEKALVALVARAAR